MRKATLCSALLAAMALVGAAGAQNFGFRGDGTGCFPKADPPTQWAKLSPRMAGLRVSADKPAGDAPAGVPAYAGAIREWQILGPLPVAADAKAIDEPLVADESALEPGAAVKGIAWRKVSVPGTWVDFSALLADAAGDKAEYYAPHGLHIYKAPYAAYAHVWLYSAEGGKAVLRFRAQKAVKAWLNGEVVFPSRTAGAVTLNKGWNRLLVKAANAFFDKVPATVWTASDYPSWWFADVSISAAAPYETASKNIRWATEMPSQGVASPLIVGGRIFVMAEPGRLLCVDKKDGRILWDRHPSFWDTLSDAERKAPEFQAAAELAAALADVRAKTAKGGPVAPDVAAERSGLVVKLQKALEQADEKRFAVKPSGHGNCLPTPISDGQSVYVILGNGLAARYDLDGNLKWATAVSPGRNQEHGITSSAALAGGKLVVYHVDLAGIDAKTGRLDWKTDVWRKDPPYGDATHQTPVTFRVGKEDYALIYGEIVRVSDGQFVWESANGWKERQSIATPVIVNGELYDLSSSGMLRMGPLPTEEGDKIALAPPRQAKTFARIMGAASRGFACASPVIHDGLAYVVDCMGTLFVVDVKEAKIVYQQDLGTGLEVRSVVHIMGTAYASVVLAGDRLYAFGMDGTTVVFKPGREYVELARNKIEDTVSRDWGVWPEGFASTPVAEGKCLYVRGDKYLYCIGEK